jgi:inorganic pyrophosphatase
MEGPERIEPLHGRGLPPPVAGRGRVHVVVECAAGSRNKYKYDPTLGMFRLSRTLPVGTVFPCDFGFIPGTRAPDGDPLDVLLLHEAATFPGCIVTARLIGVLHAQQRERGRTLRNDRLVAVVETPVNAPPLRELRELEPARLRALKHFFESYNAFQGRPFRILGQAGAQRARSAVTRALWVAGGSP